MKKALSLILALALCLTLCACGTSSDKPTERPTESMDNGLGNALPEELSKYFGEWTWEENIYPNNYANHTVIIEASGVGSVHGVNGTWRYEQPDGLTFYVTSAEGEEVSVAFFDFVDSALDGNIYLYGNVFAEDALRFGIDDFGEETVKGELYKDGPDYRYNSAVYKLNQLVADSQTSVSLTEGDATYLIDVFTALGDYKESAEYLARFKVLSNLLIGATKRTTDNLGNESQYHIPYYTYDENGSVISSSGGTPSPMRFPFDLNCAYEYDKAGQIICITEMDSGRINSIMTPTYDENGNMTSLLQKYNTGEVTHNFSYDENGNIILAVFHATWLSEEEHSQKYEYTYDDNGRLIQEIADCHWRASSYGANYTKNYEYDANGFLVKTVAQYYDKISETEWTVTYEYTNDEQGTPVSAIITDSSKEQYASQTLVYEYETLYFYTPTK